MSQHRGWTGRERKIAIALGLLLSLWTVDQLLIEPLLQSRDQTQQRLTRLQKDQAKADGRISQSKAAERAIGRFRQTGLSSQASQAENQVLTLLRQEASQAGLKLASVRPDRAVASMGIRELVLEVNAEGHMQAIAQLLYRLETATIPIRLRELKIAAKTEDSDDLSLQLRISTIWQETATGLSSSNTSDKPANSEVMP